MTAETKLWLALALCATVLALSVRHAFSVANSFDDDLARGNRGAQIHHYAGADYTDQARARWRADQAAVHIVDNGAELNSGGHDFSPVKMSQQDTTGLTNQVNKGDS